jgi:hypothetical protein
VVEPVESWPVAAGAMDLVALVDSQVGSHAGELDDRILFLRTQFAGSGTKSW